MATTHYPFTEYQVERNTHHTPTVYLATTTHYVRIPLGREAAPLTDSEAVAEVLPAARHVLAQHLLEQSRQEGTR